MSLCACVADELDLQHSVALESVRHGNGSLARRRAGVGSSGEEDFGCASALSSSLSSDCSSDEIDSSCSEQEDFEDSELPSNMPSHKVFSCFSRREVFGGG